MSSDNRVLRLVNEIVSFNKGASFIVVLGVASSTFAVLWTICEAGGIPGSPWMLATLFLVSVFVAVSLLFVLRLLRWPIINWAIRRRIESVVKLQPSVIIGIGYGGGILAGLISKECASRTKQEPIYYVIDRAFDLVQDGKRRLVALGEISTKAANQIRDDDLNVLLVTAEVHSGSTLAKANDYVSSLGISCTTFAFISSPTSTEKPDICVLQSDAREILPWPRSVVDEV